MRELPAICRLVGDGLLTRMVQGCARAHRHRSDPRPRSRPAGSRYRRRTDDGDGIPDDVDGDGIPDAPQLPPELPDPPPMSAVKLVDPVTGEFVRDANWEDPRRSATAPSRSTHFGQVPGPHAHPDVRRRPGRHLYTPEILDVLAREHVPPRSSSSARRVVENPEIVQRIVREGHMVGNHTLSHLDFDAQTDFRNQRGDRRHRPRHPGDGRLRHPAVPHPHRLPRGQPPGAAARLSSSATSRSTSTLDTNDWQYPPGEEVPVPPLDGRGHVVLHARRRWQTAPQRCAMLARS